MTPNELANALERSPATERGVTISTDLRDAIAAALRRLAPRPRPRPPHTRGGP